MALRCVLVVEDEPMVRIMLEVALKRWGFEVVSTGDGTQAQELIASGLRPCVILMNLSLPQMKAHAFREWQRSQPELRRIPMILMSGGGLTTAVREELQAEGYLSKPLDFAELRTLLTKYCGQE